MEFLLVFTVCFLSFMFGWQVLIPWLDSFWYNKDNSAEAHFVLSALQAKPRFAKVSRPGQANVVKWTAADGRVYLIAVRRIG